MFTPYSFLQICPAPGKFFFLPSPSPLKSAFLPLLVSGVKKFYNAQWPGVAGCGCFFSFPGFFLRGAVCFFPPFPRAVFFGGLCCLPIPLGRTNPRRPGDPFFFSARALIFLPYVPLRRADAARKIRGLNHEALRSTCFFPSVGSLVPVHSAPSDEELCVSIISSGVSRLSLFLGGRFA